MLNGTTPKIFLVAGSLHFNRSMIKDNARFYDDGKARKKGKERGRKELSLRRDTNPRLVRVLYHCLFLSAGLKSFLSRVTPTGVNLIKHFGCKFYSTPKF